MPIILFIPFGLLLAATAVEYFTSRQPLKPGDENLRRGFGAFALFILGGFAAFLTLGVITMPQSEPVFGGYYSWPLDFRMQALAYLYWILCAAILYGLVVGKPGKYVAPSEANLMPRILFAVLFVEFVSFRAREFADLVTWIPEYGTSFYGASRFHHALEALGSRAMELGVLILLFVATATLILLMLGGMLVWDRKARRIHMPPFRDFVAIALPVAFFVPIITVGLMDTLLGGPQGLPDVRWSHLAGPFLTIGWLAVSSCVLLMAMHQIVCILRSQPNASAPIDSVDGTDAIAKPEVPC